MKYLAIGTLIAIFVPQMLFAAPALPTHPVWIVPENAVSGESVQLSAFVYNTTQKSVAVTLGFFDGTHEVAHTSATISANSAMTLSADWKVPDPGVILSAKVTKALDANKKDVPEIVGTVGEVTVGVLPQSTSARLTEQLKGMLKSATVVIEPWRKEQAKRFADLRDEKKVLLGIDSTKDALDALNPIPPEAPGVPGTDTAIDSGLEDIAPRYQGVPVGDYVVFLYATALATIFASVLIFYTVAVLFALFVIRFVIRILV